MRIDVQTVRRALEGRSHRAAPARTDDRYAAVAAILRQHSSEAEVLLIRRAQHDGDPWSGHMAFPGGQREATDQDLLQTAVRETFEEVGLALDPGVHLIGRLDELPAMARGRRIGMIIAPFVFALEHTAELCHNIAEVDECVWTPLSPLARGERDTTLEYEYDGQRVLLPGFDVEGRVVWGLTHRMLAALFELLAAPNPPTT